MHRSRRVAALLAATFTLSIALPAIALATSTITISGATASFPLVSLLVQKYEKLNKKVKFKISQGGTQVGINDVAAGRDAIARRLARPAAEPIPPGSTSTRSPSTTCAWSPTAPTRSPTSPRHRLESIFTGKTREWSKVPGANASGPIDLISRNSTAGTLSNFSTLLIGGKKVSSLASEESSEGLQRAGGRKRPRLDRLPVRLLRQQRRQRRRLQRRRRARSPTPPPDSYAGVARFYEVTKGKATGAASAFIGWIEASTAAQKIISTQWISLK